MFEEPSVPLVPKPSIVVERGDMDDEILAIPTSPADEGSGDMDSEATHLTTTSAVEGSDVEYNEIADEGAESVKNFSQDGLVAVTPDYEAASGESKESMTLFGSSLFNLKPELLNR